MGSTDGNKRALRVRTLATAVPTDPHRPKPWDVRNVSLTGAFIETTSAIPVGTELDVSLVFGPTVIHTRAKVVRVQEPSWELPAGVGVEFKAFRGDAETFLESYISASVEGKETPPDDASS